MLRKLKTISYSLLFVILFTPSLISCWGKGTPTPPPTPTSTAQPSATITPSATPIPYQAVLKNTPLPNIQVPISVGNAKDVIQLARWTTSASRSNEIAFSPDGNSLLIGVDRSGVSVWNIKSEKICILFLVTEYIW